MTEPLLLEPLRGCTRCGADHDSVSFLPLTRPVTGETGILFTHWASCPATGEPLLLLTTPITIQTAFGGGD
jgi:hypothetical protein